MAELPKELSLDDIMARFATESEPWPLGNIVLLAFGYEYKGFDWKKNENSFPYRQLASALQATNEIDKKKRLSFVTMGEAESNGLSKCWVKKAEFFKWAKATWKNENRVKKNIAAYEKYKHATSNASPALLSLKARCKNEGDKLQIAEYIAWCKHKPTGVYKANKTKIAAQIKHSLALHDTELDTVRRYVERLTPVQLEHMSGQS